MKICGKMLKQDVCLSNFQNFTMDVKLTPAHDKAKRCESHVLPIEVEDFEYYRKSLSHFHHQNGSVDSKPVFDASAQKVICLKVVLTLGNKSSIGKNPGFKDVHASLNSFSRTFHHPPLTAAQMR